MGRRKGKGKWYNYIIISTVKEKYLIKKESRKVIEELILGEFSSSK